MSASGPPSEPEAERIFGDPATRPLSVDEERGLFLKLHDLRARLGRAREPGPGAGPRREATLRRLSERCDELRARLAMAHIRLVAHLARRFRRRGVPLGDLVQEGFCGLLEAIDRFDPSRGTKLSTFAVPHIQQAMRHAVARSAFAVQLTPRHLWVFSRAREAREETSRGEAPHQTPGGEIAGRRPPSREWIDRVAAAPRPAAAIAAAHDDEGRATLGRSLADEGPCPVTEFDELESLRELLGTLEDRERLVLSLRYGLGGREIMTLDQIGRLLGLSRERVRQVQERALRTLRAAVAEGLAGAGPARRSRSSPG